MSSTLEVMRERFSYYDKEGESITLFEKEWHIDGYYYLQGTRSYILTNNDSYCFHITDDDVEADYPMLGYLVKKQTLSKDELIREFSRRYDDVFNAKRTM